MVICLYSTEWGQQIFIWNFDNVKNILAIKLWEENQNTKVAYQIVEAYFIWIRNVCAILKKKRNFTFLHEDPDYLVFKQFNKIGFEILY